MADITFKYEEMRQSAEKIQDIKARYKAAAAKFEEDFMNATTSWEGASKEKMNAYISGPIKDYMDTQVGQILDSLSEVLKANADQMESADQQIADNIPLS